MVNHLAVEAMKSRVRAILVAELKAVCREEGLTVSGPKGTLQHRIIQRIDLMVIQNNVTGLNSMRISLLRTGGAIPPILPTTASVSTSSSTTQRDFTVSGAAYSNGTGAMARTGMHTGTQFKRSPFYESLEPLAPSTDMPPYPSHRNQVAISLKLSAQNSERLRNDSSLRILLYCAAKNDAMNGTLSDIAFPTQLEVKVNEQEVKANFKGVKNKPGSTRPADITGFVTKQPHFNNRIIITYALTQKGFTMVAMLVKKRSVDELVSRIQRGRFISREKVLSEMQARASDPDIVVGETVMSLRDPVSYVRIDVPCRSDVCTHHQCFDAASFLQLQEQGPTWMCPICNKTISFESLVVDKYTEDILLNTSKSLQQVTVQPNGNWAATGGANSSGLNNAQDDGSSDYDSDDDLVEVVKPIKRESFGGSVSIGTPHSMAAPTPPRASPMVSFRTESNTPANRNSQKRKSEVIDLTLSDDDEPQPKRPAYSTPNSLPDQSRPNRTNGYQSYPSNSSSLSNIANGPLRFQLGSGGSTGSGGGGTTANIYNHTNHSNGGATSRHEDDIVLANIFGNSGGASFAPSRPSPLSGSALAPINILDSPPRRPPSTSTEYGAPQPPTLPRFDFDGFRTPPPVPPSAITTLNANSHQRPEQQSNQRAALRALANPFGDYSAG